MRTNYPHRLTGFDYIGLHRYSLTFCVDQRRHAFSDAAAVSVVWSQFLRAAYNQSFAIIACCFMPDHVHVVVEGQREDADLKRFVTSAKQSSAYYYRATFRRHLWQRYSFDRVLRDDESTKQVVAYVLANPVRAGLVQSVDDYPHIQSSIYERGELIDFAYGKQANAR
jgi:putative transposase